MPAGCVAAVIKPQVISFLFFIVAKIYMVPLGLKAVQGGSLGLVCQMIHHQKRFFKMAQNRFLQLTGL